MGDFNAKTGDKHDPENGVGHFGLGQRNTSGSTLADFCKTNNLILTNTCFDNPKRRRYTWVSPDGTCRNQIDYIATSKSFRKFIINSKSYPGADCDTDHILVLAKIRMRITKRKEIKSVTKKYNITDLNNTDIATNYAIETHNRFETLLNVISDETPPDTIWEEVKSIYHQTAENTLGKKRKGTKKEWITTNTLKLIDQKREARKKSDRTTYTNLKKEVRKNIRKDKNDWLEKECRSINDLDNQKNSKMFFEKIKSVQSRKHEPCQANIKDPNGIILSGPEALNRWKNYGANLYAKPENEEAITKISFSKREPPPLVEEVKAAIDKLQNGKSPGTDGIPAELIKMAGPASLITMHRLISKIWDTCVWPKDWRTQEFVPLFKSKSRLECSNYRTIALISHASKILLIIILNRIINKMEEESTDEQAAYRKGKGCADMLLTIQIIIEKLTSTKQKASIIFIDYSKAFDTPSHIQLFNIMLQMGFPQHIVALLQGLYIDHTAVIRWNGNQTSPFTIGKGVRQGCIVSPRLFTLYTEQVMREADIHESGISTGGRIISNLRYADDTAILVNENCDPTDILDRLDNAGRKRGLKLNAAKTKWMATGGIEMNISVKGQVVEEVSDFKYLGSIKTNNGSCEKDIRSRIAIAKEKTLKLSNIWKDRGIRMNIKLRIARTLIWPVLIYGAEAWTLREADIRKINAAEMWVYRRILRVNWSERRTNNSILKEIGTQPELVDTIKRRKLSFFGHICRANGMVKDVMLGIHPARRRRGRPRIEYVDNVKNWLNARLIDAVRMTENRREWRNTVRDVTTKEEGQTSNTETPQ